MMTSPSTSSTFVSTEVPQKAKRRGYSPEYKRRILSELEHCTARGEIGALLRREGLYSSLIAAWRTASGKGALAGLSKKRGPSKKDSAEAKELRALKRENDRLRTKLRRAEAIIDVQKKVSEILGVDLNPSESDGND
jgi:transposase